MIPSAAMDPTPISGWRALVSVITSPGETFARLGDRAPLFPAYLLQMAGMLVSSLAVLDQAIDLAIANASAAGQLPNPETFAMIMRVGTIVSSLVTPWVVGLLVSLIALFFGQFLGGGVSLRAYMGMVGYARVPLAISMLLTAVWAVATGTTLDLSLAALLPQEASPYLRGLLTMFNPFGIWYYCLLATGFAALFRKPPARGATFAIVLFAAGALITMAGGGFSASMTLPR